MLQKLLSPEDQKHLLKLVKLIAIADKPLLWDGKSKDEITSETDLRKVSIQKGEAERKLIDELEPKTPSMFGVFSEAQIDALETRFIEKIKVFPLRDTEASETRVEVSTAIMKELLAEGEKFELPFVPKLMLFELMLLALCTGSISNIAWTLLKEVQHHYQLKDFIFDELLARAEAMNREVSKTISIVLE